ncbi:hypothetical protein BRADI_1g72710v3 [Brachypodium distachyon]|uniref:Uncharacterized protein n=1 Tax=Brachypodium distachyon TaxID=15368 RepID=I1H922_BRADI|nr:hypothetical protein BRADI_1g72710v3 [Brachypodium distachyon]
MLAYLPGLSMGAAYGAGFGGLLFLMSFAFYHVPMLRPVEEMSWATFSRAVRATAALSVAFYVALIVALFGQAAAATAVMLVADVAGAGFLSWFLCNTEGGASAQSSSPIEDMV